MRMTSALLLLVLSGVPSPSKPLAGSGSGGPGLGESVPVRIRSLLASKAYGVLTQELEAKQRQFERSASEEDALWEAFLSFSDADPGLAEPLDSWVLASRGSWLAHLARGVYLEKRAFTSRGGASIDATSRQQLEAMASYADQAERDFRSALARNRNAVLAYDGLMFVGLLRGDSAITEDAYRAAIRIAPASYNLRAAMMFAWKPRWGGSYPQMKAVAVDAQRHLAENRRLASLFGLIPLDEADAISSSDPEQAVRVLSEALGATESAELLSERGRLYTRADRYKEGLADLERALALRPNGWWYVRTGRADTFYYRGRCLLELERSSEAVASLERAAQLDPSAWPLDYVHRVIARGPRNPTQPHRVAVELGDAPVRGNPSAPVTIIEFSDFQCPFCARARPTVAKIRETYGDKVRWSFRHFPMGVHPLAHKAGEAVACAGEQGRFWEMYDTLWAAPGKLGSPDLKAAAAGLGLDRPRFDACLDSGRQAARVEGDQAKGSAWGVAGTPAFFINGRPLIGAQPFESFQQVIDDELQRTRAPKAPASK